MDTDMLSLIKKYDFGDSKIFPAPQIPEKKLINAIAAYTPQIIPDDVLVLVDDTLMGGAKEGILLTTECIFFHEFLTDPVIIKISDIKKIYLNKKSLFINGKKVFNFTMSDKKEVCNFTDMLNEFVEKYTESTMTEEEKNEKMIINELISRDEYFFYKLFKTFPAMYKLNAISNSIDTFFDQIFAVSQEQKNKAWARDVDAENAIKERFAVATYSFLKLTFEFSQKISDRFENNKVVSIISRSDCIIHEILMYILFRGSRFIVDSFGSGKNSAEYLTVYLELFMTEIFIPFYKSKLSNENNRGSLKAIALQNNVEQIAVEIVSNRQILRKMGDRHSICSIISFLISKSLKKGGVFSVNNIIEDRYQNVNADEIFNKYFYGVQNIIAEEFSSQIEYIESSIEKILVEFFS